MARQAILKAVEVALTDTLVIVGSGGTDTINPSQTLFPNILALIADLDDQATEASIYLTSDYKMVIDGGVISNPLTSFSGTLVTDGTLGFIGSEYKVNDSYKAIYTPEHMWVSTYQTSDTNWFNEAPGQMFRGSVGVDGNLSGVAYTARKKVQKSWPWEAATNAIELANSATAFQAARSFSKVVHNARQMVLAESGSANVYCKGVYYVPDISTYGGIAATLPDTWTSGSVTGDYVFCSCGPPMVQGASDSTQRAYYDISIDLTTAVAAYTWDIS